MPSLRQLAAGEASIFSDVKSVAAHAPVTELAKLVCDRTSALLHKDGLLDEPLAPATHLIIELARSVGPDREREATELQVSALTLRGTWSMLVGEEYANPYAEDVLTTDMNDLTMVLFTVPDLHLHGLGPKTLGESTNEVPVLPLRGMLWGFQYRPFVTMILTYGERSIYLPMFIDTGGQNTCLNQTSWAKLAPHIDVSGWGEHEFRAVNVHGHSVDVYFGRGRTHGVNLVGKDWLKTARALLVAGYASSGCLLLHDNATNRAAMPEFPNFRDGV